MKNAHLWKQILNGGLQKWLGDGEGDRLAPEIIKAPIIVDNRPMDGRYIFTGPVNGLVFPFEKFWIEGQLEDSISMNGHWGALVDAKRNADGGWLVLTHGILESGGKQPFWCGSYRFNVSASGNVIPDGRELIMPKRLVARNESDAKEAARACYALASDTLILLGCKNVSLRPRDNDPTQVRRAVKRHGFASHGYRYHVLVVKPAGARSDAPGIEIGTMPRHVCRGHFQHYGPAAVHGHEDGQDRGLLFGKYAGKFFSPPSLKGKTENGTVEKDYALAS